MLLLLLWPVDLVVVKLALLLPVKLRMLLMPTPMLAAAPFAGQVGVAVAVAGEGPEGLGLG